MLSLFVLGSTYIWFWAYLGDFPCFSELFVGGLLPRVCTFACDFVLVEDLVLITFFIVLFEVATFFKL